MNSTVRVAVDIGGTFTDLAAFDERTGRLAFGKSLSTHDSLIRGIEAALDGAGIDLTDSSLFLHGSTIVINSLLERTGARTGLVVTEGFRDNYEIGRINRPDAYNLHFEKHEPLVPRSLRQEVTERILADGTVDKALDEDSVRRAAAVFAAEGVEAVAVTLIHSYKYPAHEKRVAEILAEELPGVFITTSHELCQEYREFERTSTTAANAFVGPKVSRYLSEIEDHLRENRFEGRFFAVQSTGGLYPVSDARRQCVNMLESGPASGVIGTRAICHQRGLKDAIAFDMGGTTAKSGLIHAGEPLTTGTARIGAYGSDLPIQIPMIDIFEVGTGGGSIARVEQGMSLRVGPRSAGSEPGPACYGRGGTEPTVTDANLVLGRLDEKHFLGGQMALDLEAARHAVMSRVAEPLGISLEEAAEGILQIAATTMSYAVKGVTTERGLDAGAYVMTVYGGAGPLHAVAVAREIGIRRVVVPFSPGHFSAYGMLFGDLRYDFVRSVFQGLTEDNLNGINEIFDEMQEDGRAALEAAGHQGGKLAFERSADMRYIGQEHAVTVDLDGDLLRSGDIAAVKAAFDAEHLQRYGTSAPNEPAQFVSLRLAAWGKMEVPPNAEQAHGNGDPSNALSRHKKVHFSGTGWQDTPVYDRKKLKAGDTVQGPALVEEHASTTVMWPGDVLVVDKFGSLDIEVGSAS